MLHSPYRFHIPYLPQPFPFSMALKSLVSETHLL